MDISAILAGLFAGRLSQETLRKAFACFLVVTTYILFKSMTGV